MGASALISADGKVDGVDIDEFVRRILLFEKYLLVSVRLQEFPYLLQKLGFEGLRVLLSENILEIRCECMQLAQVGQTGLFGDRRLPPYTYKFNWVDAHDKEKYIEDCIESAIVTAGLDEFKGRELSALIRGAVRPLSREMMSPVFQEFVADLRRPRLLEASVKIALTKRLGSADLPLRHVVHQVSEDTFRIDNDVASLTRITTAEAHRVVECGLMGLTGLSQAIQEMNAYSALSGFREEEMPLFREKLSFLADLASSRKLESQFQRVIEIKNLPHFSSELVGVKIDHLLKVRESSEAREFRDWLASSSVFAEKEITDQVAGLRARLGLKTSSASGKAVRFLITSLVGLNPALGYLASAIDMFVLERIFPRSGVSAFVNELYPSIFESKTPVPGENLHVIPKP